MIINIIKKAHAHGAGGCVGRHIKSDLAPFARGLGGFSVGSTQRFGVPLGFGGPRAYFATSRGYARKIPVALLGDQRQVWSNVLQIGPTNARATHSS